MSWYVDFDEVYGVVKKVEGSFKSSTAYMCGMVIVRSRYEAIIEVIFAEYIY